MKEQIVSDSSPNDRTDRFRLIQMPDRTKQIQTSHCMTEQPDSDCI